jgi:hypothetical protein
MSMIETEFGRPTKNNIDLIINSKAEERGSTKYHGPKPLAKDDETTFEEEFQAEMWKMQIAPKTPEANGLRGFIARFDKKAKARAIGLGEQKFVFDGPLPTRDPNLDYLITRFASKPEAQLSNLGPIELQQGVEVSPGSPIH